MCSIFGWKGKISKKEKKYILKNANIRGRDGYGVLADNTILRGLGKMTKKHIDKIINSKNVVGNFRATPTTETQSRIDNLQPYKGIVHNGVIANDKEIGNYEIDSMVLPDILLKQGTIEDKLNKIVGSYALAWQENKKLYLANNYKPIYYCLNNKGICFASIPEMLYNKAYKLEPYSYAIYYNTKLKTKKLYRKENNSCVVACSSGLDSTTVAYYLKNKGYNVSLVHFKYNCNAEKLEIDRTKKISKHGKFNLSIIEMPNVMKGTITKGEYHKNGVEGTEFAMDWVSGRNLLMLSILTAYAESKNISNIAFGGNLEESGAYPDNEQEFGRMFNNILPYATQNGVKINLLQPLSTLMKHEIIKLGRENNVPYELSWSCYSGKKKHCGKCGPCFMRKTAFQRNGLKDPAL